MPETSHRLESTGRYVHWNKCADVEECSSRWTSPEDQTEVSFHRTNKTSPTWGESNGYWSVNLKRSWNFSPSYSVPGAPSISMRILRRRHHWSSSSRCICDVLLAHVWPIIDHSTVVHRRKNRKRSSIRRSLTYMPGVGFSVNNFSSLVSRFRTRSN